MFKAMAGGGGGGEREATAMFKVMGGVRGVSPVQDDKRGGGASVMFNTCSLFLL